MSEVTKTVDPKIAAKDTNGDGHISLEEYEMDMEFKRKELKSFRIVANPGCYPTSIQIPLIPLIKKKLVDPKDITIDSKSGYSGAGKNYKNKFKFKNFYQ